MSHAANWGRLPTELFRYKQWVVAGADKTPLAVGPNGLYAASVTKPEQWGDFNTVAQAAYGQNLHIGFVLTEADPYTVIDLDVKDATNEPDPKKHTTPQQWERFTQILRKFDSYSELSRSGKGLHIWVRGKIGQGARKEGIEVYSRERYLISTGSIINNKPIEDRQEMLDILVASLRVGQAHEATKLIEVEPEDDDWAVMEMAYAAGNSDKFIQLWHGINWKEHYPSQSEADLALMSMLTFYSRSNEQCRRLFRESALGKREKATKDNRYLDFTLITIRNRQAREAQIEAQFVEQARVNMNDHMALVHKANEEAKRAEAHPTPLHIPSEQQIAQPAPLPAATLATARPVSVDAMQANDSGLPWPPGMAGAIAQFIYHSSPRPVKEVAIVGALGLLAGVCGKVYHIPQSGLNQYIILVARSAIGKEAMHSGISALLQASNKGCPDVMRFADFSDFASGPALTKACLANPSFVNVAGEWGRKLKRLANDDGKDTAMTGLRTVMTNLYQKSGPKAIVGGITYSNQDANVAAVSGVSFSMIGETTPGTFYESLTESMMADGFLSRFTIVEYDGKRPPLNHSTQMVPDQTLINAFVNLCQTVLGALGRNQDIAVQRTNEAAAMFGAFEEECDNQINSTNEESWRQMWNRASLKVMRMSALLAVADHWLQPVIQIEHVNWALDIVRRDIKIMQAKMEQGDVGLDDHSRERKVINMLSEYITNGAPPGYGVPERMRENSIFPHKYIQIRCNRLPAFTAHRSGSSKAVDETLKVLIDNGYIMPVKGDAAAKDYNFNGRCYRILNLPNYGEHRKAKK